MRAWLVLLGIGFGSYLIRVSMFLIFARRPLSAAFRSVLGLIPAAASASLAASMILTTARGFDPAPISHLAAVSISFVIVRRTGRVLHGLLVGMPVAWLLSAI